jgi:hypothetical protein
MDGPVITGIPRVNRHAMKVTKPFRPLILILITALLGLTTGALLLTVREGNELAKPVAAVASATAASIVETSAAEPETPTSMAIEDKAPSPEPTNTATLPATVTSEAATPSPTSAPPAGPTASLVPPRSVEVTGWERVQIDAVGIGLEVPENWGRLPEHWAWSPDGSDDLQIGLAWVEPADDWSPRAMLPPSADTYETKPVNLGWSRGTSYLVEVSGGMGTVERHVIVRVDETLAVDFYARAGTTAELAALEPVLEEMLTSIILNAYVGDPVDISVRFLAALLSQDETSNYLSPRLRQVVEGGQSILSVLGVETLYSSFSVSLVAAGDGTMTVHADLDYGAGRVEERLLILVQQDGTWRVDKISIPG